MAQVTKALAGAGVVVALVLTSAVAHATARPIYFWPSVANIIKAPGTREPEVIRPSTVALFADGSWVLEKLHWTGWGSAVAHAKGISSASNGNPNLAQGQRKLTPATLTLSKPGPFLGREVYRCFQLTDPGASELHGCLSGSSGYWSLSPTVRPGSLQNGGTPGYRHLSEFLSPDRNVWCAINGLPPEAFCETGGAPNPVNQSERLATLSLNGRVTFCSVAGRSFANVCHQNYYWDSKSPVLAYGQKSEVGGPRGFLCTSTTSGITCTLVAGAGRGKGFRINESEAVKVG